MWTWAGLEMWAVTVMVAEMEMSAEIGTWAEVQAARSAALDLMILSLRLVQTEPLVVPLAGCSRRSGW